MLKETCGVGVSVTVLKEETRRAAGGCGGEERDVIIVRGCGVERIRCRMWVGTVGGWVSVSFYILSWVGGGGGLRKGVRMDMCTYRWGERHGLRFGSHSGGFLGVERSLMGVVSLPLLSRVWWWWCGCACCGRRRFGVVGTGDGEWMRGHGAGSWGDCWGKGRGERSHSLVWKSVLVGLCGKGKYGGRRQKSCTKALPDYRKAALVLSVGVGHYPKSLGMVQDF